MNPSTVKLADRTLEFSRSLLAFCKSEQVTLINKALFEQLIRSATSIGANYTEANNAASKADFKNKIFIAKKEAVETKYWLLLLQDLVVNKKTCESLTRECQYILMTLQKIINTLNYGKKNTVNAQ